MGVHIAFYIYLAALVVIGFGKLAPWQRIVSLVALVSAAVVLWVCS